MTANYSDESLRALINQARLNSERDLEAREAVRRAKEKEATEIIASIYDDAAEIALSGIEQGLDSAACYGISSALKLQALITRGDTTS